MSKVAVLLHLIIASLVISKIHASNYAFAVVESCSGCSLNRLKDVKQFIFDDLPTYDGVEFKHITGAQPELVLYDVNKEEVERLPLSSLTRKECNELLKLKGFDKKPSDKTRSSNEL